jgi:hypothetical protein
MANESTPVARMSPVEMICTEPAGLTAKMPSEPAPVVLMLPVLAMATPA